MKLVNRDQYIFRIEAAIGAITFLSGTREHRDSPCKGLGADTPATTRIKNYFPCSSICLTIL